MTQQQQQQSSPLPRAAVSFAPDDLQPDDNPNPNPKPITLTAEQQEIVRFIRDETGNLGVVARAGTGKTSTIVEMAKAMRERSALCLAFNKAIATEMQDRLPSTCTSSTLNSLGFRAWGQALGIRLELDQYKSSRLIRAQINAIPRDDRKGWDKEVVADIEKVVAMGRFPASFPPTSRTSIPSGPRTPFLRP